MKASELRKMISEIVSSELKSQLPSLIERFLTETYVRRIVKENVRDLPPSPPMNDHEGIYDDDSANNVGHEEEPINEGVRKMLERNNSLAGLFKGTRPIGKTDLSQIDSGKSVPLDALKRLGVDFAKNKYAVDMLTERAPTPSIPVPRQPMPEPSRQIARSSPSLASYFDQQDSFPKGPVGFDE